MGKAIQISIFITLTLVLSGHSQTAEKYYEMAKQVYPDHEKTITLLNKAIELAPKEPNYQLCKAKVQFLFGKIAKEQVLKGFENVLKLEPQNNYIKCWLIYVGFHYRESKKYSPLLLEIYEDSKDDSNIFYFYLNFMFNKFKSVKFQKEKEKEILERLKNAPNTFDSVMALYNFYNSKIMVAEANREIYKLENMNQNSLLKGIEHLDNFSYYSLPFIHFTFPEHIFSTHKLPRRKFALRVRLIEEQFKKYQFRFLHIFNIVGAVNYQFNVSADDLNAFVSLGLYKKTLKLQSYCNDTDRFHYVGEALYRMGLYDQAAKYFGMVDSGYISFMVFSAIKKVKAHIYDQDFESSQKFIESIEIPKTEKDHVKSLLFCTQNLYSNNKSKWHKTMEP